ncbi:GNAT family N-acetyltransferase [Ornithinimicrobium pratense]|uniref:GNAT family N-acetyltransferase n=1 Tax=Ornithinimicrobium pratense TaxID=2593973 RepID=A0A5J6V7K7_9MICO|nr:GNAT family N-acetyltransferase [Ornithinimicrobium pratense]QFG69063.1 GNAT family N-acetyltransferase [Ornithinimicrobium pratense]
MIWACVDRTTLLERTGDPFLRYAAPADVLAVAGPLGWAALVRWRPFGHWGGAAVMAPGAPVGAESDALSVLVARAEEQNVSPEWFSTAPGRELAPPPGWQVGTGDTWAFMWTDRATDLPPAPPGLVELDDAADAARVEAFGRSHNRLFEGFPGRGYASLWLGVEDAAGELAAVGGIHVLGSGAAHLAGIVVRPDVRGTGLGTGLTAQLTRRAVAAHGASTLGVYSDNAVAVGLYHRLGYAVAHHFHTHGLTRMRVGAAVACDLR